MHKIIGENGKVYQRYDTSETEFERAVVSNADMIFGCKGVYFDVKRRIGTTARGSTIPDGYYLDLMFHDKPRLYMVEIELDEHSLYSHIGQQMLRFACASEKTRNKIKRILLDEISQDPLKKQRIDDFLAHTAIPNVNALLDALLFDTTPAALIVIDEETQELNDVLSQIRMTTQVIEVQSYRYGEETLYRASSFQDEVAAEMPEDADYDELDTIVVPARRGGFEREFLGNERWFAVRIAASMLEKVKYIAAYQVSPVSAVTHVARVKSIHKYENTNKYMLVFEEGSLRQIHHIPLGGGAACHALRGPRYAAFAKLEGAACLGEIWE